MNTRYFNAEKESIRVWPEATGVRVQSVFGSIVEIKLSDIEDPILKCAALFGLAHKLNAHASPAVAAEELRKGSWTRRPPRNGYLTAIADALMRFRASLGRTMTQAEAISETGAWTKEQRAAKLSGNKRFAATYAAVRAERLSRQAEQDSSTADPVLDV
jgi:hypothetical protein